MPSTPEERRQHELFVRRVRRDPPRETLAGLAGLAARHLRAPVAVIGLLDDGRPGATIAVGLDGVPEEETHTLWTPFVRADPGPQVVPDTARDPRLSGHPLVAGGPRLRWGAGAPLPGPDGGAVGALCVLDTRPRRPDPAGLADLAAITASAARELDHRAASAWGAAEHALLASFTDAVLGLDEAWRLTFLDDAARRLYGLGDAHLGRPITEAFRTEFLRPGDGKACRAAFAAGRPWSGEVRHRPAAKPDLIVNVTLLPVTNDAGNVTGALLGVRDVTAARAAERRLRLLESAVVHASDAVVISEAEPVDAPGPRVLYVNDAYTRMTGYAAEEIVGHNPRLTQGPDTDPDTRARIRAALAAWRPVNETVLNYRKDGRPFWVSLAITPIADETGWFTHWVSVQRDVTRDELKLDLERDRRHVLEMVAGGSPLPEVLTALLRLLERQLAGMTASILLLQDGRLDEAVPSALPPEFREACRNLPIGPLVGSCGAAAFEGRTVVATDTLLDPRWADYRDLVARAGLRAAWSTPILSRHDAVLGTFAVYAPTPRHPTRDELDLLEDKARLTAVILERDRALDDMRHLALYDPLTGLANRALFTERLRAALAGGADGRLVAVGLLDLDRFKTINDTLGHPAGDELLRGVARRLEGHLPEGGSVARMGGDEFTIVAGELADDAALDALARRVLDAFRAPFRVAGRELFVTASLGLAAHPTDAATPEDLLRLADVAMYRAKHGALGWARHDHTRPTPTARHVALEAALHRAIERGELALHYQPIVPAGGGPPRSAEALLRWTSAEFGSVPPAEFVPIAETGGLISRIGGWALRRACRDAAALRRRWPDLGVGVNLSFKQFGRPDLVETVRRALSAARLPGAALTLELTESVLLAHEDAVRRMRELRALGVNLAIDDFGTGYSSLGYLRELPVNAVKIDRRFVSQVAEDPEGVDAQIVRAVALLCRGLHVELVAEGVETEAQAEFLRGAGVDLLQGWHHGRPEPLEAWLARAP